MRNVTAIVQALVTALNLFLVYTIFRENTEARKTERGEDFNERRVKLKLETMSFWIQKLIMEPANTKLHEFFNKWAAVVSNGEPPASGADPRLAARQQIEEFKSELRIIRDRVEEPLVLVSAEFSEIGAIFNDIEDVVTIHIQKHHLGIEPEDSKEKPDDTFRRLRRTFFARIYEIHRKVSDLDSPK